MKQCTDDTWKAILLCLTLNYSNNKKYTGRGPFTVLLCERYDNQKKTFALDSDKKKYFLSY